MTDTDDTVMSPGAAASTPSGASLADWLAARSDAHLTALLRARPDLAVPPPATIVVLAGRAEQRASVARAADNLTSLEFGILELLALEKADETPVSRATLLNAVGSRVTKKTVDATLDVLLSLALVWGDADSLRIVPAVVATIPWRVGRITEPTETLDDAAITAALAQLATVERDILETLARSTSIGRTRDAAPGTPADRPVPRLLAAGLLRWVDDETVELPFQVRQVLRGEAAFDPTSLTPPAVTGRKYKPADINAAAAGEALELVRHCEDVVKVLGEAPAPALRAGGLGVRELRRIAKVSGVDENRLSLLVELLSAAELIASGAPDPAPPSDSGDSYWAPTTAVDNWLNAPIARRWHTLAAGWLDLPRMPWFIGMRDSNDKPVAALSEEVRAPSAPRDRQVILGLLAELGSGQAAAPAELSRLLAWRRPRWGARLRVHAVERTLEEAATLGLVARGALSSPGRALLHGGDAEAEMHASLPDPVDHVLVQADLTVVAPGPLTPDLLEQITLVADIESAGAASMYRISEDSVRRALDAGMTAAELHSLFTTRSRTPVPQSLSYLIDDVARRHGRLRAGVASSFVRCEDPALLAEVLASPVAASLALRALAPTVAVSHAPLREVLNELRTAGFAPAGEDSSGALVDLRPRGARVPARRKPPGSRVPAVATDAQLDAVVRTLRAGDLAASARGRGGVRSDGSRASSAATVALLNTAAREKSSVSIGYVDAQGVATHRIVDPVSVGGGQLDAFDPASGSVRRFTLHRITSVARVD
ncbi:helicase-associated domain-containing protein [Rhodococcus tibetensis]|uniref:Helicase C-terminal domain-containing protein n=1 Tax=Rhodococcus tibetensis TaxID=2965064 RepID=A0ABT1Q6T7_9NOCA|nr:helicase-associated domain-containing protein [Rhodococcus sp. FXJ9.536]MCQ4117966.1 helicase C-terminal domain-containing protein [Rhodococcus sp. FXJ9.536]